MSFTKDLIDGLAAYLANQAVGVWRADGSAYQATEVAIYPRDVPSEPDRVIVLNTYPVSDDPRNPEGVTGVQVRAREAPDGDADDLLDAVFDVLQGLQRVLSTGVRVAWMERRSGVHLGRDENGRPEAVANYYLGAMRPTAHRPVQ